MSISETTVTGYSCGGEYVFREGRARRGRNNSVLLALQEAASPNYSWQYKTVLTFSCVRFECEDRWLSRFSNYLIGSATFTNLKPNTLYTMVTFLCYHRYVEERRCTIDNTFDHSPRVNISTTPLGKRICIYTHGVFYMCISSIIMQLLLYMIDRVYDFFCIHPPCM